MLKTLTELFTDKIGLTAELWMFILIAIVVLAFAITLIIGLVSGRLKSTTAAMKSAVAHPDKAVAAMKHMPQAVKSKYKNARLGNLKPSMLVTESVCVNEPYKRSAISKIWLVTLVATLICAAFAFVITPIAALPKELADAIEAVKGGGEGNTEDIASLAALIDGYAWLENAQFASTAIILIIGGLLTLIGGIVGKTIYGKAMGVYEKFAPVIDGDGRAEQPQTQAAYSEPQAAYSEPQAAYAEPQAAYAEPQAAYAEPQQEYVEPQAAYAEPQQEYVEPQATVVDQPIVAEPQESEEEIRRKAREEAMRQARAAQAQAQAQQQANPQPQAQAAAGSSTVDEVIAEINRISEQGASRDAMREVATRLQKERAKPENSSPETKKRLNEALSKLLKSMSAAK